MNYCFRIRFVLLLLLATLGGCAGVDGFTHSANQGTVYIFRLPGGPPGVYQPVLVDGKSIGSLDNGGYFMLRLAPGMHVISSSAPNVKKLELEVAKGADYYVSGNHSGPSALRPVQPGRRKIRQVLRRAQPQGVLGNIRRLHAAQDDRGLAHQAWRLAVRIVVARVGYHGRQLGCLP